MPGLNLSDEDLKTLLELKNLNINQTAPSDLGLSGGRTQDPRGLGLEPESNVGSSDIATPQSQQFAQDAGIGIAPQDPTLGNEAGSPDVQGHPSDTGVPRNFLDVLAMGSPNYQKNQSARQNRKLAARNQEIKELKDMFTQATTLSGELSKLKGEEQSAAFDNVASQIEDVFPGGAQLVKAMTKDPKVREGFEKQFSKNPSLGNAFKVLSETDRTGTLGAALVKTIAAQSHKEKTTSGKGSKPKDLFGNLSKASDDYVTSIGMTSGKNISRAGAAMSRDITKLAQDLMGEGNDFTSAHSAAITQVLKDAKAEDRLTVQPGEKGFPIFGTDTPARITYESPDSPTQVLGIDLIAEFNEEQEVDDDVATDLTDDDDENEVLDDGAPVSIPVDAKGKIDPTKLQEGISYILNDGQVATWNGKRLIPVGK